MKLRMAVTSLVTLLALGVQAKDGTELGDDTAARVALRPPAGATLPPNLIVRDETGASMPLRNFLGRAPILVVFTYFTCSNLCPTLTRNLELRLREVEAQTPLRPQVLVVSIDPADTPTQAAHRKSDLAPDATDSTRWHFLTSPDGKTQDLAEALGFHTVRDGNTGQFAHSAAVAVLTATGQLKTYVSGVDFAPSRLVDSMNAPYSAAATPLAQQLLLLCFHFEPASDALGAAILGIARLSIFVIPGAVVGLVLVRRRRVGSR